MLNKTNPYNFGRKQTTEKYKVRNINYERQGESFIMKIGAIIGSLREHSYNRVLFEKTREMFPDDIDMIEIRIDDIPFMNPDYEYPAPDSVVRLREEFEAMDAIWMFTPEYNHTLTAAQKNVIDWLSRAVEKGGDDVLAGKLITYSGVGFGLSGTTSAQDELAKLLSLLDTELMNYPRVTVGSVGSQLDENGVWVPNEMTLKFLQDQIDAFLIFIQKRKACL